MTDEPAVTDVGIPPFDSQFNGTPTLNHHGWMIAIEPITQQFIDYACLHSNQGEPAMEVATAYGSATLAVLQGSNKAYMIVNDLEPKHTQIIQKQVQHLGQSYNSRLKCIPGPFPEAVLPHCQPSSLSCILMANLLHFLKNPDQVAICLEAASTLLQPGGLGYRFQETGEMSKGTLIM